MIPGNAVFRTGLASLLSLVPWTGSDAQERAPVVQTVDLLVPVSPMTVTVAGRTLLVYELHVTNFLPDDVSLKRVQVVANDRSGASLAEHRGDALAARIGRPGLRRGHGEPRRVGPGMRAIVYLWIELDEGAAPPAALRHRVELEVLRPAAPLSTIVEGAASSVSREDAVALGPPLRGGPWAAVYDPLLVGGHRTVPYATDGRARIPGRFAIDWIRLPASGVLESGPPPGGASDWNGYGSEVLAVADAVVAAVRDDVPDNEGASAPQVALGDASGNYVALDLGRGRYAFYEHLKHGSVVVKVGERVRGGQRVASLGSSGSTSVGPHLHFHVADANSPLGAEGLPFVFKAFEQLGAFASIQAFADGQAWRANPGGQASTRRLERPAAMSVVRFP
jgi:murein DD-endopeptidase MepM/ murein hydrolase activator NlpD